MTAALHVAHVGVVGDAPSGMAQVVNEYMSWSIPHVKQAAIATTRGRRDRLAPFLLIRALGLLVVGRLSGRVQTVAIHLSERGSFVREGTVVALAQSLGLRVVLHLHGAEFVSFAAQHPRLVSNVLRRAHAVAALTVQTREVVERLAPDVQVTLVPNVVSVPSDDGAARMNGILFAGEIGERKGVDVLLEAWRRLGAERADWQLHVVGPDKQHLLASVVPISGLTYHGSLQHSEVMDLARRTRVAVLPSRQEALPMFLLESMARGNMPIGTPVGQVSQLVEGVGLLVEPGSVQELTDALRRVCENRVAIDDLGRSARDRVIERYSTDIARDGLVQLWQPTEALGQVSHAA